MNQAERASVKPTGADPLNLTWVMPAEGEAMAQQCHPTAAEGGFCLSAFTANLVVLSSTFSWETGAGRKPCPRRAKPTAVVLKTASCTALTWPTPSAQTKEVLYA